MNAQETHDKIAELKESTKKNQEEISELLTKFNEEHQELEFPVTVEDKEKWFRVYAVSGHFVYNHPLEMGLRATPQNAGV